MGMGGYGSYMPVQPAVMPSRGKGNYYPGMGYLPEARNSIGPDWSQPPQPDIAPNVPDDGGPVGSGEGNESPFTPMPMVPGIASRPGTEASFGPGLGPDDRPLEPTPPGNNDWRKMLRAQRMPFMGGMYGVPFYGGMPSYGGMFGMPQMPFYGGLGGFLGGGYGFGGGPMYGGFRRRFMPQQTYMPYDPYMGYDRQPYPEYTPPSQEAMEPLLEEFTNFYLNDFQGRPQPATQRSSTMRSMMSPYGLGSLLPGG